MQARILTITDAHLPYAKEVVAALRAQGIRVEEDFRNESVGKKIREGRLMKIPYLVVVGDNEVAARTVSVRNRETGEQQVRPLDEFGRGAKQEVDGFALKLGM